MKKKNHLFIIVIANIYVAVCLIIYVGKSNHIGMKYGSSETIDHNRQHHREGMEQVEHAIKLGSSASAFKIYIYDLPPAFNEDIVKCHTNYTCYDISESGYGKLFSVADGIHFRNTFQGGLDITIHQRLLQSAYRTMDPSNADVFYIPYYADMLYRCTNEKIDVSSQHF